MSNAMAISMSVEDFNLIGLIVFSFLSTKTLIIIRNIPAVIANKKSLITTGLRKAFTNIIVSNFIFLF